MVIDLVIILLVGGGFLLGFVRNAIRQMLAIAAWFVTFLLAAQLSAPVGRWLAAQATAYSTEYATMLSFGGLFVLLFGAAVILFEVSGTTMTLTRHALLDSWLGGVLGVILALLTVLAGLVILDSYHAVPEAPSAQIQFFGDVYQATRQSVIAEVVRGTLGAFLGPVLAPLLPDHVRAVMG